MTKTEREEFLEKALKVSIHRSEQALIQLGETASPVVREWIAGIITHSKAALEA